MLRAAVGHASIQRLRQRDMAGPVGMEGDPLRQKMRVCQRYEPRKLYRDACARTAAYLVATHEQPRVQLKAALIIAGVFHGDIPAVHPKLQPKRIRGHRQLANLARQRVITACDKKAAHAQRTWQLRRRADAKISVALAKQRFKLILSLHPPAFDGDAAGV